MAVSMYLKIDGVPGDSTGSSFGDIEVLAYNHGVSQSASRASAVGGGASGECHHADFSVIKALDSSSPLLAQKCSQGETIKEVVMTLVRTGTGAPVPYMTYKLQDVIISSIAPSGAKESEWVTESVSFNYAKITWEFTKQKRADGSGGGKTTGTWDLVTHHA
jgi:type VI secretion system secreted protein Hcp